AARLAQRAYDVVKTERLKRGFTLDPEVDPAGSAFIGTMLSPVTSSQGNLSAKQTSVNPNFGAVLVQMLKTVGVQPGDLVAVGMSGSFPALNVATLAALDALDLRPLIVVSAAASQYGANDPNFVWLDMQRLLWERDVFPWRPLAASLGGIDDHAVGMSAEGRRLLDEAIARSGVPRLDCTSLDDSVQKRMAVYLEAAGGAPIKAYINVGGGTTSVGTHIGKQVFKPGLNMTTPPDAPMVNSVMQRFSSEGVPVLHLVSIERVAHDYGLPVAPTQTPALGDGKVFMSPAYNPWLAAGGLGLILATMVAFVRMDIGFLLRRAPRGAGVGSPLP
ncbi:MAG TPA: poly-gamma-glutamate system protein, partial [Myxococcota bacterium]|nr:poly-gamma-glutamate system protein [Myxococcota bacterium]